MKREDYILKISDISRFLDLGEEILQNCVKVGVFKPRIIRKKGKREYLFSREEILKFKREVIEGRKAINKFKPEIMATKKTAKNKKTRKTAQTKAVDKSKPESKVRGKAGRLRRKSAVSRKTKAIAKKIQKPVALEGGLFANSKAERGVSKLDKAGKQADGGAGSEQGGDDKGNKTVLAFQSEPRPSADDRILKLIVDNFHALRNQLEKKSEHLATQTRRMRASRKKALGLLTEEMSKVETYSKKENEDREGEELDLPAMEDVRLAEDSTVKEEASAIDEVKKEAAEEFDQYLDLPWKRMEAENKPVEKEKKEEGFQAETVKDSTKEEEELVTDFPYAISNPEEENEEEMVKTSKEDKFEKVRNQIRILKQKKSHKKNEPPKKLWGKIKGWVGDVDKKIRS